MLLKCLHPHLGKSYRIILNWIIYPVWNSLNHELRTIWFPCHCPLNDDSRPIALDEGGVAPFATVSWLWHEVKTGAGKPWSSGRLGDSACPLLVKSLCTGKLWTSGRWGNPACPCVVCCFSAASMYFGKWLTMKVQLTLSLGELAHLPLFRADQKVVSLNEIVDWGDLLMWHCL